MSGRYVAVGSSMAAGPGIKPRVPGSPARAGRSTLNYPHLVAERLGYELVDVTYSGATTANLLADGQHGAAPQFDALDGSEALVTVTIGGNDAAYMPVLLAAGLPRFVQSLPAVGHVFRDILDPEARDRRADPDGRVADGRRAGGAATCAAGQSALRGLPHVATTVRHTGATAVRHTRRVGEAHRGHIGADHRRGCGGHGLRVGAPERRQSGPPRVVGRPVGVGLLPAVALAQGAAAPECGRDAGGRRVGRRKAERDIVGRVGHIIELSGLTKTFGRNRAVDDLTCSIEPGVVTGFLGPNGAGKTTTMRMVLGLDRPTSGTATIGGRSYRQLSDPLRTVGALLDAKQVHPNRSARDHLRWLAATNRIADRRVDEVLDRVGLESAADKNAGALSLGMSQRLGIAAALLGDPPVLMFDEPVNGLDPEGIRWVRTLMRTLAAEGRTVFVSSHLLAEMANTADRLVVIGRGKLIASTTVAEFVNRSSADAVRVRSPQLDTLADLLSDVGIEVAADPDGSALEVRGAAIEVVGELAARNAIVLHELSVLQASLEDAYLRLTDADVAVPGGGAPVSACAKSRRQ